MNVIMSRSRSRSRNIFHVEHDHKVSCFTELKVGHFLLRSKSSSTRLWMFLLFAPLMSLNFKAVTSATPFKDYVV